MLRLKTVISSVLLIACINLPPGRGSQETAPQSRDETAIGLDQVVRRIVTREKAITENMRNYSPLIETYVQRQMLGEDEGAIPKEDEYLLGRIDWKKGLRTKSLLRDSWKASAIFGSLSRPFPFQSDQILDVFAGMILVDKAAFDEKRYQFRYIRREFLGEMRCLVFELRPERKVRDGFSGRIWVEDKDFTIVRFNGVNAMREDLHFDSWRLNLRPGQWLPSYVYIEDSEQGSGFLKRKPLRLKAQTRLWGYSLKGAGRQEEFTAMRVDGPTVQDQTVSGKQASPVWSQRAWERQAEDNVLERLEAAGLLAPDGEVDKVLKTVVTNLEITNNLEIDPEVRCRVLLTSPLEAFTVGHTIVLSRGLIDVLPDEGSLAAMLAHEMGHILLGHQPIDTKYAFSDRMLVPDKELLDSFRFGRKAAEESAADLKAMEVLKNSPYKEKLANAGLFLRTIAMRAKQLPSLIQAHMGDGIARDGGSLRMNDLMNSAPKLELGRVDQIAALPLGGRVEVDPWDGRLQLMKSRPAALVAAREKMPLEVTPFMPYLIYSQAANAPLVNSSQNPR
jgi:hypothetical protein